MEYVLDALGASMIDKFTIESGTPGIELMERAADCVVELIEEKITADHTVICFAGKGNNGGDAVSVARKLYEKLYKVICVLVIDGFADETIDMDNICLSEKLKSIISPDLYVQLEEYCYIGAELMLVNCSERLCELEKQIRTDKCVLVDGLFGTGLKRAPEGLNGKTIRMINKLRNEKNFVVAIDIPSGVNATDGNAYEDCIDADYTVTFGYKKLGHLLYPGREHCGRIITKDIGFLKEGLQREEIKEHIYLTLSSKRIKEYLPKRSKTSNKGSYGKVLVIAGSDNMPGACILSTKAAFRTGCGLVTVCSTNKVLDTLVTVVPEAILSVDSKIPVLNGFDSCLIGPGLGKTERSKKIVSDILMHSDCTSKNETVRQGIVVDADAINVLADFLDDMELKTVDERISYIENYLPDNLIFTPHKKELSRLLAIPMERLSNLYSLAVVLRKKFSKIFVLKDASTIVVGGGQMYINTTGNNGMSTAGAGDVLGGIIVSMLAQGLKPFKAAVIGVCIHGHAGDMARDEYSEYGVMASDISDFAAKYISRIYQ